MGTSLWDLSGKVAIVTGATRGLGRAMADALAGAGANIVVTSRSPADCEKVAAEIERLGVRALPVPGDVSKKENIERLVGRT
ncbi:MAG: SDR family NAD(P)-dependent oxidoreductase, partial [Clostridia bacterium]|nr:SDR family NAD(P)-dependent oxidoreductase [Clostridia bacterium]